MLEQQLTETRSKLENSGIELEAHEGLLRLSMEDMRRIYEELMTSQARLMQSDKLASIGLLSAGIAHEIHNPLCAAQLAFSLLDSQIGALKKRMEENDIPIDDPSKGLFEDMEGFIHQGQRCAESMAKIVTAIRTFSRSDQGVSEPEDVNTIIDNVISLVWNSVKNEVKIHKEYGKIPKIRCNAQQLGQVFLNLLVNASQAMDSQGVITITTSEEAKFVCVKISDTGCGMSQAVMDRIFEPFFTTKGAEEGTGLGLYITSDMVKKHDGEIRVESVVGKGSVFTVLLPVRT